MKRLMIWRLTAAQLYIAFSTGFGRSRPICSQAESNALEKVKIIGLEILKKKWVDRFAPLHSSAILLDPRAKNLCRIGQEQREPGLCDKTSFM